MSPKVTVLIPVYNGDAYLREAIDSVLAQTFGDFELLLVDDCSTDGSAEICNGYRDDRIRVLRNERNLGQVPTLNRGLSEARGEYVARLDQDDMALPARLERQVELLEHDQSVCVVGTWMDFVDDAGRVVWKLRERLDDFVDAIYLALVDRLPLAHPTVTFRREAALALGGYDPQVKLAEDQDLWRRLLLARQEARVVPELLVRYRVHAGQQSQQSLQLQLANNAGAIESFISALSPAAPAHDVRRLLAGDDASFWRTAPAGTVAALPAALDHLVADAAERVNLSDAERDKLDRLLRARVRLLARRAWREGLIPYWRKTRPLARWGDVGATAGASAAATFVFVAAPALRPLYLVKTAARRAVWTRERFQPVKRFFKRIGLARSLYRAFGGRA